MRRNAVIPYAIIAIVGILAMVVIAIIGVNQREDIANGDDTQQEDQAGETVDDPEAIYEASCAACHGGDLSGGMGPDLTQIGADMSVDEIKDVITNGQGSMPAQSHLSAEEVTTLSEWLGEMQ